MPHCRNVSLHATGSYENGHFAVDLDCRSTPVLPSNWSREISYRVQLINAKPAKSLCRGATSAAATHADLYRMLFKRVSFSCQLSLCHHASSSRTCTACGVSLKPCQAWHVLAEAAGSFAVSKGWLIPDLASQQTVLAPYGGFVQEDWLKLCVKVVICERRQVRAHCLL